MGNFYTNHTLHGVNQQAVADHMTGRNAFVSPAHDGYVVVFDEQSDDQDPQVVCALAAELSGDLSCPLLSTMNHDDGVLMYYLYRDGELIDEYNSCPGYFGETDDHSGPTGGSVEKLCEVFGVSGTGSIEAILRKPSMVEGGYIFEVERHYALFQALGLPEFAVGLGYRYFEMGQLPENLDKDACIRTH